jgi:sterol desaturase/sphingolipid hydroxylase (fatty acid hydroxylase superfamily)
LTNISLVVLGAIVGRLLGPLAAMGVAVFAAQNSWGLFNLLALPVWLEIIVAVMLLDMAIYWQHVATHKIPVLWRLHRVHHADRDIDASTGVRFHPIEIGVSMLYKCAVVLILGPAAVAVLLFEVLLNASALFNHANLRLPSAVDKLLRSFMVTPDMHRVHHSVILGETNSNYGFFLSWWDKLFNSYKTQPQAGHQRMTIGLNEYQTQAPKKLTWALLSPFTKD